MTSNPFVRNPDSMVEIISVAKTFGVRPSSLISNMSGYMSYCFDVAAAVYVSYLEDGEKPIEMGGDATEWL